MARCCRFIVSKPGFEKKNLSHFRFFREREKHDAWVPVRSYGGEGRVGLMDLVSIWFNPSRYPNRPAAAAPIGRPRRRPPRRLAACRRTWPPRKRSDPVRWCARWPPRTRVGPSTERIWKRSKKKRTNRAIQTTGEVGWVATPPLITPHITPRTKSHRTTLVEADRENIAKKRFGGHDPSIGNLWSGIPYPFFFLKWEIYYQDH